MLKLCTSRVPTCSLATAEAEKVTPYYSAPYSDAAERGTAASAVETADADALQQQQLQDDDGLQKHAGS